MAKKQVVKIKNGVRLSNTNKKKLYASIISAILDHLRDSEDNCETGALDSKIEYFGNVISKQEFEIKESKEGERYYAY